MLLFVRNFILALCILTANASYSEGSAHDYKVYGGFIHVKRTPGTLYFVGDIRVGDDFELRKALRNHNISTLILDSPGGSVWDGLAMAGIIHDRNLSVYVPANGICASACAFMFFAGEKRTVDGQLGVHQFKSSASNQKRAVGEVQGRVQFTVSEIIGYLNEFETPRFVFEKMFQQEDMYWFDADERDLLETEALAIGSEDKSFANNFVQTIKNKNSQVPSNKLTSEEPVAPFVKNEPEITEKDLIRLVQEKLNFAGCNAGIADGIMGVKTVSAMELFAKSSGLKIKSDFLYDKDFIEALSKATSGVCPKIKFKKKNSKSLPLQIARHWKVECKGVGDNKPSYFRVTQYDNLNGKISFEIVSYDGKVASAHGKIIGSKLHLYDGVATFSDGFRKFKLQLPDCPKGFVGEAVIDY